MRSEYRYTKSAKIVFEILTHCINKIQTNIKKQLSKIPNRTQDKALQCLRTENWHSKKTSFKIFACEKIGKNYI